MVFDYELVPTICECSLISLSHRHIQLGHRLVNRDSVFEIPIWVTWVISEHITRSKTT